MNERAKQWIVQGGAVSSGLLEEHIASDSEIKQLRRIASDVLVLEMTSDRAQQLKTKFADLSVEPDEELEQFC